MKEISLDNGNSYITARKALETISREDCPITWDAIVNMMDDDTREAVAAELAPCSELEFLARYLEIAPADLIIG